MLIYCTTLWLSPPDGLEGVVPIAADWLSRRTSQTVSLDIFSAPTSQRFYDGSRVQTVCWRDSWPRLTALRYTHADRDVSGRQWITEIGMRQDGPECPTEVSIRLDTSEVSARVTTPPHISRPGVVLDLVRHGNPAIETPGQQLIVLDSDHAVRSLGYEIDREDRRHPLVLVSPTPDGSYLVPLDKLVRLLCGFADVIRIPRGLNTYFLGDITGNDYAAWGGAVTLIYPRLVVRENDYVPAHHLLPTTFAKITAEGRTPESEILSFLTHRLNLPNSWRHISIDNVADMVRRRDLARLRNAGGEVQEYVNLLEEEQAEQARQLQEAQQTRDRLQADLDATQDDYIKTDDLLREARHENEGLKLALAHRVTETDDDLLPRVSDLVLRELAHSLTPRQALSVIEAIFPERLVILPTAWKSADESWKFRYTDQLLPLLWRLVNVYRDKLLDGRGDTEARGVFGDNYAAGESETVAKNKGARERRRFNYKGRLVEMMPHLRIGSKDSAAETIRVHFLWDPEVSKFVIGWCGPHIEFH